MFRASLSVCVFGGQWLESPVLRVCSFQAKLEICQEEGLEESDLSVVKETLVGEGVFSWLELSPNIGVWKASEMDRKE